MTPGRAAAALSALLACAWANLPAAADELDDYLFSPFDNAELPMRATAAAPPAAAWLGNPELRIAPEQNEFERSSQTYSLRFRPAGSKERKAIEAIARIDNRMADMEWRRSLNSVLAKRYHRVIELAWQEVSIAIAEQRLSLDRSLLVSQQMVSATTEFETGRLQSAALRLELLEQEIQQAQQRTDGLRTATLGDYLAVSSSAQPRISERLIAPLMIRSWLDEIESAPTSGSYRTRIASLEVDQAAQQVALEKSRSKFGLSLVEFSYEDKVTDSYNVTFGFRLPFGQDRNASYRRARELGAARQQLWLAEQTTEDDIRFAVQEMRWRIDNYVSFGDGLQKFRALTRNADADAGTIAELREHELNLLEAAAGEHVRLLHDFVDLLELTGQLRQPGNRNWIRRNIT